jgi:hypothetical protein
VFANYGGDLQDKTLNTGSNHLTISGTTSAVTDGDPATFFTIDKNIAVNSTIWYEFPTAVNVKSYQILAENSSFYLAMYNAEGNLIRPTSIPIFNGTKTTSDYNRVKKVALRSTSTTISTKIFEFELFTDKAEYSLLDGFIMNRGFTIDDIYNSVSWLTDDDLSTTYVLGPNGGTVDTLWHKFTSPKNIDSYRMQVTKDVNIEFYDPAGVLINTITGTNINFSETSISVIENVGYVAFVNTQTSTNTVAELEVYEAPLPIYPITNLTTTKTHNSVNLSWANPISVEFAEIQIKQDGVVIANLPKTISNYAVTGLSLNTTYTYEVAAKYNDGRYSSLVSLIVKTDATGPLEMSVNVNPGLFRISHFTNSIAFESYELGAQNGSVKLRTPFSFSIEDFSGTWNGWNIQFKVDTIINGSESLKDALLETNCLNSKIYDSDSSGTKIGTGDSINGVFACNNGALIFGTPFPLLTASSGIDTSAKHYFEFPYEFLNLSFSNQSKSGSFTGQTTLILITGP